MIGIHCAQYSPPLYTFLHYLHMSVSPSITSMDVNNGFLCLFRPLLISFFFFLPSFLSAAEANDFFFLISVPISNLSTPGILSFLLACLRCTGMSVLLSVSTGKNICCTACCLTSSYRCFLFCHHSSHLFLYRGFTT